MKKLPQFGDKYSKEAVFNPDDFFRYIQKKTGPSDHAPPEGVIFCYQSSLYGQILKNHEGRKGDGYYRNLYFLKEYDFKIAVAAQFGIGAPAAVALLEELIAVGVKRVISIGSAGGLQLGLPIGGLVILTKALRDEGCSHHYLPSERFAFASPELTNQLATQASELGLVFHQGSSWTIDTPYRETKEEVLAYQQEGLMVVEMEAAALFAVAQFRNIEISSMVVVSDSLADLKWNPQFFGEQVKSGLEKVFQAALSTLAKGH